MDDGGTTLEAIYRTDGPQVRAFLARRTRNADEADELVQETFLAAARRPELLEAANSKRAWLIGIAVNVLRARRRRRQRDAAAPLPPDVAGPMARSAEDPRVDAMHRAMGRLPEQERETLELRLLEDLSYAEIAEALQIPIGTVRSRLHNAILKLRNELTG